MIKITLKDGSVMEQEAGLSIYEVAQKISERLAKVATSALLDGEVVDLRTILDKDCSLSILTFDDEEGKGAYRHTTSHIMAQAVKKLFPNAKLAIGPSIENGFYYDYDVEKPFSPEDLENIEKEMKKICDEDLKLERFTLPRDEALKLLEEPMYDETEMKEYIDLIKKNTHISDAEFDRIMKSPTHKHKEYATDRIQRIKAFIKRK